MRGGWNYGCSRWLGRRRKHDRRLSCGSESAAPSNQHSNDQHDQDEGSFVYFFHDLYPERIGRWKCCNDSLRDKFRIDIILHYSFKDFKRHTAITQDDRVKLFNLKLIA